MVESALLTDTDFFRDLSEEDLGFLLPTCTIRNLRRGDLLFEEGDDCSELFVVSSGLIAISKKSIDGRESVVALMERGELFGEMGMLDGLGRSAEARALEPSEVVAIPYAPIRQLFEERPALLWGTTAMLVGRLRAMDEALADSVFLDVTGRTAKRLLELAGEANEFYLPVTQEELAGMVGASRERVNKAISSFIRLGWLEQSDRHYRIVNRDRLAQRSR
jgi:CRP/FNR family transcriptional regulator, cyclic AMP receptor protein